MMTVGELIEHLSQYPSELRVVVNGYEDGFDDVVAERIRVLNIKLNTGGGLLRPLCCEGGWVWIPAFAGMTERGAGMTERGGGYNGGGYAGQIPARGRE